MQDSRIPPTDTDGWCDRAREWEVRGDWLRVAACYEQALAQCPEDAHTWCLLGQALDRQYNLHRAVECFARALSLNPNLASAHVGLGNALRTRGRLEAAIDSYGRALMSDPACLEALNNLANAKKDTGDVDAAIELYRQALHLQPNHAATYSNLLYALLYSPQYDAQALLAEHLRYDKLHAAGLAASIDPHGNDRSKNRRLRIGYVSPDFRLHAESFFTVPLFASHDHSQFEIFAYSDVVQGDAITQQLRRSADVWRETRSLADEGLAALIRKDQIDILVDLTTHMQGNRLLCFARRPAPVQVCWLAYPGTSGLTAMDYRLTDPFLDTPDSGDGLYSETSIRLADTYWCYDPLESSGTAPVNPLPALTTGQITFGSLNNFCKTNPAVFELWARVLRVVPDSRLLLLAPEGAHCQRMQASFERLGIAGNRVQFVAPCSRSKYLELYHQIDLGLDTFPYSGHTTSLDALWMGVPVVTLVGQTVVGRAGYSQLMNLGFAECIANSPEEFVAIAQTLTNDLPRLAALRQSLRARMQASPLMDHARFARSLESAYREMWKRWCQETSTL